MSQGDSLSRCPTRTIAGLPDGRTHTMNRINYLKLVIATIPLTVAAFTPVVRAEGQPNPIPTVAENQWRGSVTPYMWLMNVSGAVARNGDTLGSVHLDTNSLLSNLNVAAMIEGEVHAATGVSGVTWCTASCRTSLLAFQSARRH